MNKSWKPYDLVTVREDGYSYVGQVLSFPTPEQTVMVRRVPGHPGTLEEMLLGKLAPAPTRKPTHVFYAAVAGSGSFPVDMLWYDFCAPVNFKLRGKASGRIVADIDPSFGSEELLVATTGRPHDSHIWTPKRWRSFLWSVRAVHQEEIGRD